MQTRRLNALTPSTEHLRSGVRRNLIDCISWPLPSNGCKSLLVIKPAAPMKYQPMSTNLNLTRAQCIINWLHANSTQKMSHRAESRLELIRQLHMHAWGTTICNMCLTYPRVGQRLPSGSSFQIPWHSCIYVPMFQRASTPSVGSGTAPDVALQDDIQDMYAENVISASRAQETLRKCKDAGVKIAIKAIKKSGMTKKSCKNAARNLRRSIRRYDKWPDPYWFNARVWDRVKQKEAIKRICIMLPSEVLETIWRFATKAVLLSNGNFDKLTKDHHARMKAELNISELLGFGLHGDGVPCNYDRTESVMLTSINLPGLTGKNGRLRIPLIILPDHVFCDDTFDDIYEVLAWDMRSLLSGVRHECRHDNSAWETVSDKKRSKMHGMRDFRSCLVQVRSDWDWLTKCYHFPGHGSTDGLCWHCSVKRDKVPWKNYGVVKTSYTLGGTYP